MMAALFGMAFFLSVLVVSVWTIAATVRPRLARIAFLLEYGPVIGNELPPVRTVRPRARSAELSVPGSQRLRSAA